MGFLEDLPGRARAVGEDGDPGAGPVGGARRDRRARPYGPAGTSAGGDDDRLRYWRSLPPRPLWSAAHRVPPRPLAQQQPGRHRLLWLRHGRRTRCRLKRVSFP